ncbi:hypothetical protein ES705_39846 [subsurface metagenome]
MKKLIIVSLFITFRLVSLANEHPNIIFFLIDDQRYDHLSMLDHPFIQTPNIDELAKNGIYFSEAFVIRRCGEYTFPKGWSLIRAGFPSNSTIGSMGNTLLTCWGAITSI